MPWHATLAFPRKGSPPDEELGLAAGVVALLMLLYLSHTTGSPREQGCERLSAVGQLMTDQLKAGAQTRDGERDLEALLRGVISRSA